jgi:hypothetical protein
MIYFRFVVLTALVMKSSTFWDITLCSPLEVNRRFGESCRLHPQGKKLAKQETSVNQVANRALLATWFTLVSSTLKMEAKCSETSVVFQRTTRRYTRIPEYKTRQDVFIFPFSIITLRLGSFINSTHFKVLH